jgi:hypothetical protein
MEAAKNRVIIDHQYGFIRYIRLLRSEKRETKFDEMNDRIKDPAEHNEVLTPIRYPSALYYLTFPVCPGIT